MIARTTFTVALLALLIAAPAGAATAEPSLAVTIGDGVDEARPGDTLDYVATVSNHAGETFEGIVTITVPAYLDLSDGSESGGSASWEVTVPAGESRDIRTTATVGEVTGDEYQVVVIASVAAADRPLEVLVRAAEVDRIPDTPAPAPVAGMTVVGALPPSLWAILAVGAVVVVGAVGGLLVALRGRRAAPRALERGTRTDVREQ